MINPNDSSEFRPPRREDDPSIDLFRLLVSSVRDYGIFMLDPAGHITTWNEGARRIKGYTADEILGRHFSVFYPPEDQARDKPGRELAGATAEGRFEDEGWRVRKDGTLFWANVVITALRDDRGTLVGFAKVTRDLTDRRAAEARAVADARALATEETARRVAEERAQELASLLEQLQAQAAELEQQTEEAQALAEELEQTNEQLHRALTLAEEANRAKMDFLATMSHELRTPLNAITGYTQLLDLGLRGPITGAQREDLARIRDSGRHLLGLINDVLNYARLEAGKVELTLDNVPLRPIVEGVVALMTQQAVGKGLALSIEAHGAGAAGPHQGHDVLARIDDEKVRQILLNLLSNAIKFTLAGGSASIAILGDDHRATIRVRDTGIGIPPDKLEYVFEPFVQLGRSLTRQVDGTGLGLAISRDLARAMGGDLWAESREGVGSTFVLVLPRA